MITIKYYHTDYNKDIIIHCSKDNIQIEDSYIINKEYDIKHILDVIKIDPDAEKVNCIVFQKRTIKSLTKEWIAHNVLYKLHIARSHTKSVDLNIEIWYRMLCYNIIYFVVKPLNYFVIK